MKTENTLENKQKFFDLYAGQKVFINTLLSEDPVTLDREHILLLDENEKSEMYRMEYLELVSLSEISSKDLSDLTKILNDNKQGGFDDISEEDTLENIELSHWIACGADFLRSRGYLVPWMGLSIDDLIQYGWVKIKERK